MDRQPKFVSDKEHYQQAVCRVKNTISITNHQQPWLPEEKSMCSGSAYLVWHNNDLHILTNAHVVEDAEELEIEFPNHTRYKVNCDINKVGDDCDLAVLDLPEDIKKEFIANRHVFRFDSNLPKPMQNVRVIGYPAGEGICYTTGNVSKINDDTYAHSGRHLPEGTTDAAVNPGNSGGCIIDTETHLVLGSIHQGSTTQESTNNFIPNTIVTQYLDTIKKHDDEYKLMPDLCLNWQNGNKNGVIINGVPPCYSDVLKEGDKIRAIDGIKISPDGFLFLEGEQTQNEKQFESLIAEKEIGDKIILEIKRNREIIHQELEIKTRYRETRLIEPEYKKTPSYLICGPYCFQKASVQLFEAADSVQDAIEMGQLFSQFENLNKNEQDRTELILLNPYYNYSRKQVRNWIVIERINGIKIKNMEHLAKIIDKFTDFLDEQEESSSDLETTGMENDSSDDDELNLEIKGKVMNIDVRQLSISKKDIEKQIDSFPDRSVDLEDKEKTQQNIEMRKQIHFMVGQVFQSIASRQSQDAETTEAEQDQGNAKRSSSSNKRKREDEPGEKSYDSGEAAKRARTASQATLTFRRDGSQPSHNYQLRSRQNL